MEFLDPKKQKLHHIYLMISYGLTTIGIILATIILLSFAYGFGVDRTGQVTQNGLVFASSTPSDAAIYINNKQHRATTNTKILLETGRYTIKYQKDGYTSWQRSVVVNGGVVDRYDYALLVPTNLKPAAYASYDTKSTLTTQSRDKRWALVQLAGNLNEFLRYDLKNPEDPAVPLDVPAALLTNPNQTRSWKTIGWANNNRHVLFDRSYADASGNLLHEYILFDRQEPTESQNLSRVLGINTETLQFRDDAYDKYYVFNEAQKRLSSASLKNPELVTVLSGISAYKSYGNDILLYVQDAAQADAKATVRFKDGDTTYDIGKLPARDTYMLDMARHDGAWFVALGAQSESRIAVYKNPVDSIRSQPKQPLVPIQVLKVSKPTYLSFSANSRFILATNNTDYYTYDIDDDKAYKYAVTEPLDTPQVHPEWMDSYRISYVSGGKIFFFDYDYTNKQTLIAADANFTPMISNDTKYLYSLTTSGDGTKSILQQTPLRISSDL